MYFGSCIYNVFIKAFYSKYTFVNHCIYVYIIPSVEFIYKSTHFY